MSYSSSKEFITVPIYKKGVYTNYSNYVGITLLSTTYKILSHTLLSWLAQYVDKIIGDYHCEL
jgi:hypothetical protein